MLSLLKLVAGSALLFAPAALADSADVGPRVGGPIQPHKWYTLWNNGQNFLSVDTITNKDDNSTHYLIGFFAPGSARFTSSDRRLPC